MQRLNNSRVTIRIAKAHYRHSRNGLLPRIANQSQRDADILDSMRRTSAKAQLGVREPDVPPMPAGFRFTREMQWLLASSMAYLFVAVVISRRPELNPLSSPAIVLIGLVLGTTRFVAVAQLVKPDSPPVFGGLLCLRFLGLRMWVLLFTIGISTGP